MSTAGDERQARIMANRQKAAELLRSRAKRVIQDAKHRPLLKYETDLLEQVCEGTDADPPLAAFHRWIAFDLLWQGKQRNAPKHVAQRWKLSVQAVRKYASEYKQEAEELAQIALFHNFVGPLSPQQVAAVEHNIQMMADAFHRLTD
jgi:TPR repeat protein